MKRVLFSVIVVGIMSSWSALAAVTVSTDAAAAYDRLPNVAVRVGTTADGGYSQKTTLSLAQTVTLAEYARIGGVHLVYESASAATLTLHVFEVPDPQAGGLALPETALLSETFEVPATVGQNLLSISLDRPLNLDAGTSYAVYLDTSHASAANAFAWRRSSGSGDFYTGGAFYDDDAIKTVSGGTRDALLVLSGVIAPVEITVGDDAGFDTLSNVVVRVGTTADGAFSQAAASSMAQTVTTTVRSDVDAIHLVYESASAATLTLHIFPVADPLAGTIAIPGTTLLSETFEVPASSGQDLLTIALANPLSLDTGTSYAVYVDTSDISATGNFKWRRSGAAAGDFYGGGAFYEEDVLKIESRDALLVLSGEAEAAPSPPAWTSDPLLVTDGVVLQSYHGDLSEFASDPNFDEITFVKVPGSYVGPGSDWLTLADDGTLSGIPGTNELGHSRWTVEADDGVSGVESTTLVITVGLPTTAGAPTNGTALRGLASYGQFVSDYLLSGADAGRDADPDGDGVSNGSEYIWLMNPTRADAEPILLSDIDPLTAPGTPAYGVDAESNRFSYATVLRNDDPYLHYELQFLTNLLTGAPVAVESVSREHAGRNREVINAVESTDDLDQLFVQLSVTGNATGTVYHIENQADFNAYKTFIFSPGDQILFKRGAIFSGMFAPQGSGVPGRPIVLGNYGSGPMPIINALGINEAAIHLFNVEHWEVHNMEVTNTDGSDQHQGKIKGIYVETDDSRPDTVMDHIYIKNCYVHDVNGTTLDSDPDIAKRHGGIHVHTYGSRDTMINDLQIVGNTVEKTGGVGIGLDSGSANVSSGETNYLWTGVYVAHNFINDTDRNNMIIRKSVNALAEYNVLANSSRSNKGHSLFNFHTVGFTAQHNEAYGNVGYDGADRGGYDADYNARDTVYQYNYSHDNMWCIGIMKRWNKGVDVRYNISQNDEHGFCFFGFNSSTECEDVRIYNNIYYVGPQISGAQLIAENRTPHNTDFMNNIFYYENGGYYGSGVAAGENTEFSHNAYVGIPAWGTDPSPVTADPLLTAPGTGAYDIDMSDPGRLSGYRLQAGSPCINAGTTISGVARDFWGHPVPASSGTDIGPHEVQL